MILSVEGKTESIWDRVAHCKQELFVDNSKSEETNDSNNSKINDKKFEYVLKGIPVYEDKYKHVHGAAITGDVACNSYYKVDEDVSLLKELGVCIFVYLL